MRFQFVWYTGFHIGIWIPEKDSSWIYIYDWIIYLGFLQIRKWSNRRMNVR